MIHVFGFVKCGFPGCEVQYDTTIHLRPVTGLNGQHQSCAVPVNKPKGWAVSDFYTRCPEHAK